METQPVSEREKRAELFELYRLALDDYRFQVQLNQDRSRYFLVLNLTVIGIATGVVQLGQGTISALVAILYLAGFMFCLFSIFALKAQRKFYRSARDQKQYLETRLELGAASITPVERSESKASKLMTFKGFVNFMFVVLAVLNLIGAGFVVAPAYFTGLLT